MSQQFETGKDYGVQLKGETLNRLIATFNPNNGIGDYDSAVKKLLDDAGA